LAAPGRMGEVPRPRGSARRYASLRIAAPSFGPSEDRACATPVLGSEAYRCSACRAIALALLPHPPRAAHVSRTVFVPRPRWPQAIPTWRWAHSGHLPLVGSFNVAAASLSTSLAMLRALVSVRSSASTPSAARADATITARHSGHTVSLMRSPRRRSRRRRVAAHPQASGPRWGRGRRDDAHLLPAHRQCNKYRSRIPHSLSALVPGNPLVLPGRSRQVEHSADNRWTFGGQSVGNLLHRRLSKAAQSSAEENSARSGRARGLARGLLLLGGTAQPRRPVPF
jgi:hypothetical protein